MNTLALCLVLRTFAATAKHNTKNMQVLCLSLAPVVHRAAVAFGHDVGADMIIDGQPQAQQQRTLHSRPHTLVTTLALMADVLFAADAEQGCFGDLVALSASTYVYRPTMAPPSYGTLLMRCT